MVENKFFSKNWIYKNIFNMSEDDIKVVTDEIIDDAKHRFRLTSIEEDGDDPAKPFKKIGGGGGDDDNGGDEGGLGSLGGGGGGGGGVGGMPDLKDLGDEEGGPEGEEGEEGEGKPGEEKPEGEEGEEGGKGKGDEDELDAELPPKKIKESKTPERDQSGEHVARRDHRFGEDPLGQHEMNPDTKDSSERKKKSAIGHNFEGGSPLRLREIKSPTQKQSQQECMGQKPDPAIISSLSAFLSKTRQDTKKELIKESLTSESKSLMDESQILE
jgi:hypothetical protein